MTSRREAALKAWETIRRRKQERATEEEQREEMERMYEEEKAQYRKEIRDTIRDLGGINDSDYESVPIWAKRRAGRKMDEVVMDLKEQGHYVEGADDVCALLQGAMA